MNKLKQCSGTKGYACGKSCISVKKVCRKDNLSGQSVQIMNNFEKGIVENSLAKSQITKKVSPITPKNKDFFKHGSIENLKDGQLYRLKSKYKDYTTQVAFFNKNNKNLTYEVTFKINDTVDVNQANVKSREDAMALSFGIKKDIDSVVKQLPNGTILSIEPYVNDNKGAQRAKLYKKAGFKPVGNTGRMRAKIVDGKIV